MSSPQRIVSLISSGTEILFGLGLGERVVGVSHECDFPPEALQRPRVTATRIDVAAASAAIDRQVREMAACGAPLYEIDTGLVEALRPDLIVTQAQCDVCAVRYADVVSAVESRPALRGTKIVALNPACLADIFADIRRVAQAAGCPAEGHAFADRLARRVDAVRRATATHAADRRPRTLCLEWLDPPMAAGNWMPELIELAGGWQDLAPPRVYSPYVTWERIAQFDPEVIVVMPCGFGLERTLREAELLRKAPQWRELSAVRGHALRGNGGSQRAAAVESPARGNIERVPSAQGVPPSVFAVDGNAYFNRSGPRMVESLEILAHLLHADVVPPPQLAGGLVWQRLEL
ncbi:MAG: cobalamin-binding protein [Planctomycetia bacterium]|nr:cobalamin-binding protein [Planctomycetia bacterium]